MKYGPKSLTYFGAQKKKFHNPTDTKKKGDKFHSLSLNHNLFHIFKSNKNCLLTRPRFEIAINCSLQKPISYAKNEIPQYIR